MARNLWKGTLQLGLVSMPTAMVSAKNSGNSVKFRQLHRECLAPVKMPKTCSCCGELLKTEDIVSGFEYAKGTFVVVEDEDVEKTARTSVIEILEFVPSVDPIYLDDPYWLTQPAEESYARVFACLLEVLRETELVAVGRMSIWGKERFLALRPGESSLLLQMLRYEQELNPEPIGPRFDVEEKMKHLMMLAVAQDTQPVFLSERYRDMHTDRLRAMISAKLDGVEYKPEVDVPRDAPDLMEILRQQVEGKEVAGK